MHPGDCEPSGCRPCENFYLDGRETAESLFAGDSVRNLKTAGERLHVSFAMRDTSLRVTASGPEQLDRALSFLNELKTVAGFRGGPLDQNDFEQILNAAVAGRPSEVRAFYSERIPVGPQKRPVVPRTINQLSFIRAIRENDIVFGTGPAGTGKTFLAVAMAVSWLLEGKADRIVLTRPAVEAGENLGFLPGKLEDKVNPFLRPLYDSLYDMLGMAEVQELNEKNVIEIAPLAFMRGRTLSRSFVILDEAQNTTGEQMLMFLTRLGPRSRCVVCGDPTQTDLPRRRDSGLLQALRILKGIGGIALCSFTPADVVRHSLVERIVRAYEDDRKMKQTQGENSPEPEQHGKLS